MTPGSSDYDARWPLILSIAPGRISKVPRTLALLHRSWLGDLYAFPEGPRASMLSAIGDYRLIVVYLSLPFSLRHWTSRDVDDRPRREFSLRKDDETMSCRAGGRASLSLPTACVS